MLRFVALLLFFVLVSEVPAQIRHPHTPQLGSPTPINPGQSYTRQNNNYNQYNRASQTTSQAEQIKSQLQRQSMQNHGQSQAEYEEIKKDFNQIPLQIRRQQEMEEIFKDVNSYGREMSEAEYLASTQYKNDFQNYRKAADLIKEMLEGKRKQSLKDAYYLAESAYGNLPLSYDEYTNIIKANVDFISRWLFENNYPQNDPEALHLGIRKFLADTLYIGKTTDNIPLAKKAHYPYSYDYIDAQASNDRRNYFVTKTLATGTGQCHTLPVTYLLLAEALNVPVSLSYNPQHSFIQYKNNMGVTVNYETTIDRFLPDQFYLETLPKMAKAQRNNIYLSSLSKKQILATVIIDLAVNYVREHQLADKQFIEECLKIADTQFSGQDYINTSYSYLKKRLLADVFNRKIKERKIQTIEEIEQHPDIVEDYNRFRDYMMRIEELGIQDFPEHEYIRMMNYHDEKGKLQNIENKHAKEKKNLFFNY
jgi:hypothetical protein